MTQKGEITPSATERAEQILTRAGEQLGFLAGRATLRFRQTTQAIREEADHLDEPESEEARQAAPAKTEESAQAQQPTLERAEELVDQLGQRVGHWAMVSNAQMKRAMARLREDAEDMWVEAQDIHNKRQGPHKQA